MRWDSQIRDRQPFGLRHASLALVALVAMLVIVIGTVAPARASRRDWVGSAACGACHPAQLTAWLATPHAKTRARFGPTPASRCLACHGTGEAPAGPTVALEVGCESCHGAGAAYAEDDLMRNRPVALALGLVDVSTPKARAALCAGCHARRTMGTAFDPTAPVHSLPAQSP